MRGLVFLLLCFTHSVLAGLTQGTDETAGLPFWEWKDENLSIRFVQRLPDQTRAYFAGRGFADKEVRKIASWCVFQTVYTNISSPPGVVIRHDINDWRLHYRGENSQLKARENWAPEWRAKGIKQAQIVAFEWSLFPSSQVFQAGDYNWGMTFLPVPHGETFSLKIAWKVDGKQYSAMLEDIACARDETREPA